MLNCIYFLFRELLMLVNAAIKAGKEPSKVFSNISLSSAAWNLVFTNKRGNNGIFVLQNTTLRQTLDNGVCGGRLPTELFFAEINKLTTLYGFVFPQNQTKTIFAFKNLRCRHIDISFL